MGRAVLFMAVMLTVVATPQTPGLAQSEGEGSQYVPGEPRPSRYEVTEGGMLVYDGDYAISCEYLAELFAQGSATFKGEPLEPVTREAVNACTEAGFGPEGAAPSAPISPDANAVGGTLPETGGLPAALLGAGACAVAAGGLMILNRLVGDPER